jgi:hypothetical protein
MIPLSIGMPFFRAGLNRDVLTADKTASPRAPDIFGSMRSTRAAMTNQFFDRRGNMNDTFDPIHIVPACSMLPTRKPDFYAAVHADPEVVYLHIVPTWAALRYAEVPVPARMPP